jgi:hypothetical protein
MADPSRYPDSTGDTGDTGDTGMRPGRGPTTGTPRWVKALGIIAIVLVLLVVTLLLTGHGPGRHLSSGDTGVESVTEDPTPPGDDSRVHALHAYNR